MDLREDEESKEKFGQIIDLLLAAGYFRARISTLPPFDKVHFELKSFLNFFSSETIKLQL